MAKTTWGGRVPRRHVGRAALKTANSFSDSRHRHRYGASLNRYATEHGTTYPDAHSLQIDLKSNVRDEGWPRETATVDDGYVQADARLAVEALNRLLDEHSHDNVGFRTGSTCAVGQQLQRCWRVSRRAGHARPARHVRVLDETIATEMGMALGGGATLTSPWKRSNARDMLLAASSFGCVSQMLPATMGAIAATGQAILMVDGDARR